MHAAAAMRRCDPRRYNARAHRTRPGESRSGADARQVIWSSVRPTTLIRPAPLARYISSSAAWRSPSGLG